MSFLLALALQAARHAAAQPTPPAPEPGTPAAAVAAAPAGEWVTIAPDDLVVMDLAADAAGQPRRVVIQLMPAPFSTAWVANIRALARAHWWDGLSVNRVQDNYVAQWGDPGSDDKAHAKPLPAGLQRTSEAGYVVRTGLLAAAAAGGYPAPTEAKAAASIGEIMASARHDWAAAVTASGYAAPNDRDPYAEGTGFRQGWPVSWTDTDVAPVHCYASVGVGRDLSPDAGSGAELYAVIGQAPRQLDRNIAVVGRVIAGIEFLSALPRGTGALGFYATAGERTPIARVRLASDLPAAERPAFQHLSTGGAAFARYAQLRANRHDSFYIRPAGGVDVCNVPVPVRRVPG